MLEMIMPWVNPLSITIYLGATLLIWFLILTLEYGLNSGQLGRGRLWMFECFWEDVLMNIPGGSKIKADRVYEMVNSSPNASGSFVSLSSGKGWTYEELRESGEYEKCGRVMFGSAVNFWAVRIIGYLLLAFSLVPIVALWIAMSIALFPAYYVIDKIKRSRKDSAVR